MEEEPKKPLAIQPRARAIQETPPSREMVLAVERRSSLVLPLRQTGWNLYEVRYVRNHLKHAPSAPTRTSKTAAS